MNGSNAESLVAPPQSRVQPPDLAATFQGVFTPEQLDWLEKHARLSEEIGEAGLSNGNQIRRCKQTWLSPNPTGGSGVRGVPTWLLKTLSQIVIYANKQHFRFKLTGFVESLQLVHYHHTMKGKYDWHMDTRPDFSRKLSISVQLTDPPNYEGGDLQIMVCEGTTEIMPRLRGSVIIFPSYAMHRVTEVTDGARNALVCWVAGPPFQ